MASRNENENKLFGVVSRSLKRWLGKAREAVMAPWHRYRVQPDPSGIYQVQGDWNSEVETILTTIGQISMDAWSQATDVPPVSRHAFVVSQLAMTQNLLVRMPDEVYNMIFAEITDGVNGGDTLEQIAERVERVLTWTGSENWPSRARTIAATENTRAYGAGTLAGGMEQSRLTGRILQKRWDTERDNRVRSTHRAVNGDTADLWMPFYVGTALLQFPGDPLGPPEEVINCRCDLVILNEERR